MLSILVITVSLLAPMGQVHAQIDADTAITIARKAAGPSLEIAYRKWVKGIKKRKGKWVPPAHDFPWLEKDPNSVSQDSKTMKWLVVWEHESKAGWSYWSTVEVNAKGIARVLTSKAFFAPE